LNVHTGARAAGLLPTAKATRPQRQHEPGPFGCRDLGLGPQADARGGHILSLLSDLTWLIGAMRLIRGSRVHPINHEAPIHHAIFRALATKASLRNA
jgi:hypothetical protein